MNLNQITVHNGVFESILDFPDQAAIIDLLLDPALPVVLMVDVCLANFTWKQFEIFIISRHCVKRFMENTRTDLCICALATNSSAEQ